MRTNKLDVMKYLSVSSVLLLLVMFMTGCSEEAAPTATADPSDSYSSTKNPIMFSKGEVVHHVSMGGADLCEAVGLPTGCDANFSLEANVYADGSISGQWQDTFAGGVGGTGGVHVVVDCINIFDNFAIIGGVITQGNVGGVNVIGQRAVTAVVDNGTSTNDTPDQLSLSFIGAAAVQFLGSADCNALTPSAFQGFLFNLTNGQVTVW